MSFYDFPENSLVVVSSPKSIVTEWRFVVAKKTVIAGSEYNHSGVFALKADYDPAAYDLAVRIAASSYQPDPVWVIDICKTSAGEYRLLEIGGFSFADLYACDKAAIVRAVSQVAADIWNEKHD